MRKKNILLILMLTSFSCFVAGCAPRERGLQYAEGFEPTVTLTPLPPTITPRPTFTPRPPTPEPLQLSSQRYTLNSSTMTFHLPAGWEVQIEDEAYIRVARPDGTAWLEAAVDSTGYELTAENFSKYIEATLASLYGKALNYEAQEIISDSGYFEVTSTFQKGEYIWHALDVFSQRGKGVFLQSFQADERYWERYLPTFREILASTERNSGYIGENYVYQFTRNYTAPNDAWTLHVPLSWSQAVQEIPAEGATAETITSPDGEAMVQVILVEAQELLDDTDIGQVTINMLRDLEGEDLVLLGNALMNDGRLRIDWEVKSKNLLGRTYFWLEGSELNVLTFKRTNAHVVVFFPRFQEMEKTFRSK